MPKHTSSINFKNIPYDSTDQELRDVAQMAGPFREFKLKIDPITQSHKGYGFCEYADPDVAASALRNLAGTHIRSREIHVNYPSEHKKSGSNLRPPDVLYRDRGEVINPQGVYVDPAGGAATVEDVLAALTPEQEHMILYAIKEVWNNSDGKQQEMLIDQLAKEQDGQLLEKLLQMQERVQSMVGGPQNMAQGGIFHAQPSHQPGGGQGSSGGPSYYYQPNTYHNPF